MTTLLDEIKQSYIKQDVPDIHTGDTVKVSLKIVEGSKERIQHYEGVVVRLQGAGVSRRVVVRRVVSQIGVEKSFPLHSPRVTAIKVLRSGKVRKARLFYLRDRVGRKATRIAEKKTQRGDE